MSFFSLGNFVSKNLNISGKMLLVAGLFTIPIVVLIHTLVPKYQEKIDFAESETRGVKAITPMRELMLSSQKHRGILQKILSGNNDNVAILKANESDFEKSFEKVYGLINENNLKTVKIEKRINNIKNQWKEIIAIQLNTKKADSFKKHSDFIDEQLGLITDIADETQLTLDPELVSYYVMDAAVVRVPIMNEYMAQIRGLGVSILIDKKINNNQREQLLLIKAFLTKETNNLLDGIGKASASNSDAKEKLAPLVNIIHKDAIEMMNFIDKEILVSDDMLAKTVVNPDVFFNQMSTLIEKNSEVFEKANNLLMVLFDQRISVQRAERNQILKIVGLVYLFLMYIFICVRRMIAIDVKSLRASAEALSQGDFNHKLELIGRDEMHIIGELLLKIRQAIQIVVTDVDLVSAAGREGNLNIRADESKHHGEYQRLVGGLNETLNAIVVPLNLAAEQIAKVADGIIPAPIDNTFKGSFHVLASNLNKATASIQLLVIDANSLVDNAVAGRLNYRAETDKHRGDFKKIIEGVNATLDAVIEPLTLAISYVDNLAKGVLPPLIEKNYQGDFSRLTLSLNKAITSIATVVRDINSVVNALKQGDLTTQADTSHHQGEYAEIIGGVNEALKTVADPIHHVGHVFSLLAQGDLRTTVDTEYEGAFGELATSANVTIEQLRDIVGKITGAVDLISTAAKEISAGNTDLSQRTEEQASGLEETASSLEELTSTVQQNANNATLANELATSAFSVAKRGTQSVAQVVSTMKEINGSSQKISEIIGVIDSIAFQTNILALNAAVEAARAGEQGRGFAVVASEVRNLAQRSAAAAKEIKTLISDSVQRVDLGAKIVDEAGEIMNEINHSVEQVAKIIAEISTASVEQSGGIRQVNQAISQMDHVTQQNAALVEEAAAAAESLEDQADQLASLVRLFKLENHGNSFKTEKKLTHNATHSPLKKSNSNLSASKNNNADNQEDSWESF
ncbi:MAG: methyl-accepting chemotaxis protein [Pseudomonadota bacterium]